MSAADREVFRLVPPLILWWVWVAFAVANVTDFAVQGAPGRLVAVVSAILVAVTGLAYALALRPRVIAGPDELHVVNPFRDHHVPWTAIGAVDVADWVRIRCDPPARPISCWALYISARSRRRAALPRRVAQPRRVARYLAGLPQAPAYPSAARLPEEARRLASLPPAQAIAARLDTRASRARACDARGAQVASCWAWLPLAAVALPLLALAIVALIA